MLRCIFSYPARIKHSKAVIRDDCLATKVATTSTWTALKLYDSIWNTMTCLDAMFMVYRIPVNVSIDAFAIDRLRCDGILIRCIQSNNWKFRSRLLVGKTCTGKRPRMSNPKMSNAKMSNRVLIRSVPGESTWNVINTIILMESPLFLISTGLVHRVLSVSFPKKQTAHFPLSQEAKRKYRRAL